MQSSDTKRLLLNCNDKVTKKIVQNYTFILKSSLSFVDVVTGPCTQPPVWDKGYAKIVTSRLNDNAIATSSALSSLIYVRLPIFIHEAFPHLPELDQRGAPRMELKFQVICYSICTESLHMLLKNMMYEVCINAFQKNVMGRRNWKLKCLHKAQDLLKSDVTIFRRFEYSPSYLSFTCFQCPFLYEI